MEAGFLVALCLQIYLITNGLYCIGHHTSTWIKNVLKKYPVSMTMQSAWTSCSPPLHPHVDVDSLEDELCGPGWHGSEAHNSLIDNWLACITGGPSRPGLRCVYPEYIVPECWSNYGRAAFLHFYPRQETGVSRCSQTTAARAATAQPSAHVTHSAVRALGFFNSHIDTVMI